MPSTAAFSRPQEFVKLGFKLGFGGAVTFERALRIRQLAAELPLAAHRAGDRFARHPPHWLYRTAGGARRRAPQARNEPAELARIGAECSPSCAASAWMNWRTRRATTPWRRLPKLAALLPVRFRI